jgi:class 3 adenylate cyclase
VDLLDGLSSEFEAMAERHRLEKIETVGDAYMKVAALPEPRSDAAQAVFGMAVEMQRLVTAYGTSRLRAAEPVEIEGERDDGSASSCRTR